ncbi:TetR/AcrR family transcriptional regulator [Oxalobacteraceae bacterium CAVE-383]|nr:TetR/AcrR family transcriptional regulator [Oxalobacteraceae bacterium CAVE-383]
MARVIAERADVVPLLTEIFRTYGYEGASLARIGAGTGLGKGSLYHFFPGGKDEMAAAVLAHIDLWFQQNVYAPLRETPDARRGIAHMFRETKRYFLSGQKVCLVGVFALGNERDRFAVAVKSYFVDWAAALADALRRDGKDAATAMALSEDVVGAIQGALVLARAMDKPKLFVNTLARLEARLLA